MDTPGVAFAKNSQSHFAEEIRLLVTAVYIVLVNEIRAQIIQVANASNKVCFATVTWMSNVCTCVPKAIQRSKCICPKSDQLGRFDPIK